MRSRATFPPTLDALSVRVVRPQKGPAPFTDLYSKYPNSFVYLTGPSSTWRHTRQQFVTDVDALVTVGGADGTYQAALELRLTRKRLVPIVAFGGASSRLLAELLNSGTLRDAENSATSGPRRPPGVTCIRWCSDADGPMRNLFRFPVGHAGSDDLKKKLATTSGTWRIPVVMGYNSSLLDEFLTEILKKMAGTERHRRWRSFAGQFVGMTFLTECENGARQMSRLRMRYWVD